MSALPIITEITNQGITARVEGDEVALSAPKGTLTPEVIAKLKSKKPELLRSLKELQERAEEDWEEISADSTKLKAFAALVMITDMRHRESSRIITPQQPTVSIVVPYQYLRVAGQSQTDVRGVLTVLRGCPCHLLNKRNVMKFNAYIVPENVEFGRDYRYPYVRIVGKTAQMSQVYQPGFHRVRPPQTQCHDRTQDYYTEPSDSACPAQRDSS